METQARIHYGLSTPAQVAERVRQLLEQRFPGYGATVWNPEKSATQGFLYCGTPPCYQVVMEGAYDWPQSIAYRVNAGEFGTGVHAEPANGFILDIVPVSH